MSSIHENNLRSELIDAISRHRTELGEPPDTAPAYQFLTMHELESELDNLIARLQGHRL